MRFKKIFFRAAAIAAAAAMVSCGVWAVDSEYDYDFQIDVSMFSNAELGTVGGDTVGESGAEITRGPDSLSINGYEKQLSRPIIYMDGAPMIALNSLRDFMECSVYYDPSLYTAYVIKGMYSVRIALGSNLAIINNTYSDNWSKPLVNYGGELYAPVESLMRSIWYTADCSSGVKIVSHAKERYGYAYSGDVHVVYIDPLNIHIQEIVNRSAESSGRPNYSNSTFFGWESDGDTYSVGILVSDGRVISDVITHGSPVTTLIVHYDGSVEIKRVSNIHDERNVLFAVSGVGVLPEVTASAEGFYGTFDIDRYTNRTYLGYNRDINKIVLCVSPSTTLARAGQVLSGLGCASGLALDGGGSAALGLDNGVRFSSDGRKQYAVLYWD